ncbi:MULTISPECIES: autorepressor SdpR family transcription factor [Leuconostoc]|uniref:Transcriptional repressor SdpR n=1 Tax=Leuconostoc suionicum TaxID=1511761 RepID=A0A2N9KAU0_9LACO|nr:MULTISPECIES: autorepressor SdpR family transcription factor [Leuconostoc]API71427.1 transcriptional regulator [Leuconostoc suionicum]MBE4727926.1 winged helix-turn-helix transcriptional regulator [Leuconostoc suionicum]MBS1007399.1 winged helix-turn-helix transcriptional regulator [Leuconostoc suionicum]MCT4377273.1 ArsR family transcriptional regulator [Leuconostoc suionicum]MCT4401587.1 ArsR family transcriptional regulator [Leuconostoc suionicum]
MSLQNTLKAISNPVRRDILTLLKEGPQSAGNIADHFELSKATISSHLAQLKQADLIREDKYKNFIYYELNLSVFEEATLWLKGFTNEK